MPGYITHSIMAEELFNEVTRIGSIKLQISKEELRGYSLGADLAVASKKIINDPHDINTREFFLTMIKYIKDNNLKENSHIMALLYGHIAHYFLDINAHPLIYYIECGCKKIGFLPNHDLVEGYISSFLTQHILNKNIMEINQNYFNHININDIEVSKMLNNIYGKVYNDYEIIKSYRKILDTFCMIENVVKSGMFSKEMLVAISKFDLFLEINNLSTNEITNENKEIFTNPVTGEKHNESFIELYNRSIEMTLNAISKVNEYLYSNGSIMELYNIFTNLSYNTGKPIELGKQMIYVRKNNPIYNSK